MTRDTTDDETTARFRERQRKLLIAIGELQARYDALDDARDVARMGPGQMAALRARVMDAGRIVCAVARGGREQTAAVWWRQSEICRGPTGR